MTLRRTLDVNIRPDISRLLNRIGRIDRDDAINLADSGGFSCCSDQPAQIDSQWESSRFGIGPLRQDLPLSLMSGEGDRANAF